MMKIWNAIIVCSLFLSCSNNKLDKKGFQVREISENEEGEKVVGLPIDSLKLEMKPGNVLLTKHAQHRLTPIFKVNHHKKTGKPFTGSNAFHLNYQEYGLDNTNNWNNNFMPGFEAAYGYNFVNISHYDTSLSEENHFFERPVLIKTLYFPALSNDTLNSTPVNRDFYMVSTYDEDTDKDGYISVKDLRRLYHFNINAKDRYPLVPKNYSVTNSEYDPENDFMYVFARLDEDKNGQMEYEEPTHIFWINLKNPQERGLLYQQN